MKQPNYSVIETSSDANKKGRIFTFPFKISYIRLIYLQ